MHQAFLSHQVFRKTYFGAKKEIDEWLRTPSYKTKEERQSAEARELSEQSVELLKQQLDVKQLTRSFVRQLKNADLLLNGEPIAKVSKRKGKHLKEPEAVKPSFEMERSRNIMLVTGSATDTRVLVETFLQANLKMRSRYKCAAMHCAVRENRLT